MADGLKKQMADKALGLNHTGGLNMMEVNSDEEAGERPKKKTAISCPLCDAPGHKTRRSRQCRYHDWEQAAVDAEMVRILACWLRRRRDPLVQPRTPTQFTSLRVGR